MDAIKQPSAVFIENAEKRGMDRAKVTKKIIFVSVADTWLTCKLAAPTGADGEETRRLLEGGGALAIRAVIWLCLSAWRRRPRLTGRLIGAIFHQPTARLSIFCPKGNKPFAASPAKIHKKRKKWLQPLRGRRVNSKSCKNNRPPPNAAALMNRCVAHQVHSFALIQFKFTFNQF